MATIALQQQRFNTTNVDQNVAAMSLPVTAAQTVNDGDILVISSGTVQSAASNAASGFAGIALHASGAVYAGGAAASSVSKFSTPFGAFTSGFNQAEVTNMHFLPFSAGTEIEISLNTAVALAQTLVGSSVSIKKDVTTGFYYADTVGNNVATVVEILQGPNLGVIGTDNGGRLLVRMLSSVLGI